MAGTPHDSLYVLDVLYDRAGLAVFAYAPQLADLPDQKMWGGGPEHERVRALCEVESCCGSRDCEPSCQTGSSGGGTKA